MFGEKALTNMLSLSREKMAQMLHESPDKLNEFDKAYQALALDADDDNLARPNAKLVVGETCGKEYDEIMVGRVVDELLPMCQTYSYKRGDGAKWRTSLSPVRGEQCVTRGEIESLPRKVRPQLTSRFVRKDIDKPSYPALMFFWDKFQNAENDKERRSFYHHFRQGLDILDLDDVLYAMLGHNKNSMGYWLPRVAGVVEKQGFFKIPDTTILKVPLPVLQLTRTDFGSLTGTSLEIVNRLCQHAFDLDENKEYFIKTGTYSSKFDFRNAHIRDPKEVREIGGYFLYLQNVACEAAGPLAQPSIYGMSTTNEWCVREYIPDVENNPTIYKGLPLHTEYRFFVDFTYGVILGYAPYWDADLMKKRFCEGGVQNGDIHDFHDYVVYQSHEAKLMERYEANVGQIESALKEIVHAVNKHCQVNDDFALWDQWSIDVMQNGNDFWLIDMAVAENSALYSKCVPPELRSPSREDWLLGRP